MADSAMDRLVNRVLLEVPGCPVNLIDMKLREVANEFISRTQALSDDPSGEDYSEVFLERCFAALSHGAIAGLMLMDKRPWSNSSLAAYHRQEYNKGLTAELNRQNSGGIRA